MDIIEFVERYGDRTFADSPFCEVDSLIFSELVYIDISAFKRDGFGAYLKDSVGSIEQVCENSVHPRENTKLLKAVLASERYSRVKIGYAKEKNDETIPMRFAAASFLLENGHIYLAFRGTDITIAGWQEDFNLLFQNTIPSQKEAVKYLEYVMSKENTGFFVGGHSKGGNLAVYASTYVKAEFQERIDVVFNHDGPGFHDGIFDLDVYKRIEDRIFKYVPHDSLIGMLLEHTQKYSVVKCKKNLFGQHDPFAWEVKGFSFVILPNTAVISQRADVALHAWMGTLSQEEKKSFVSALFKVIYATGKTLVRDLTHLSLKMIIKMVRAYRELPTAEHDLVKTGGRLLFKIWLRILKKNPYRKLKYKPFRR